MRLPSAVAAILTLVAASTATARPVTDCPQRDDPFSIDLPLIDLLASPAARAIVDRELPGAFDRAPKMFVSQTVPSFAALLSIRSATMIVTAKPGELARLDRELRALRVTQADKTTRCARYDNDVPWFSPPAGRPRILLFEKINGFRDGPSVAAARAAFLDMAKRNGWVVAVTDKGGAFNAVTLRQFDAVIWNNISGDVLTLSQRRAFRKWLEAGKGFIGVHGSAGDPTYFWDWYADSLIGARFKGHPMWPQFQDAHVVVDDPDHPVVQGLPRQWIMNDEWYSFKASPRASGSHIIATLDESTYKLQGMGQDLQMGDHPIAWTRCVRSGRIFYSAIGHRPEIYSDPRYVRMLENAIDWAATGRGPACRGKGD